MLQESDKMFPRNLGPEPTAEKYVPGPDDLEAQNKYDEMVKRSHELRKSEVLSIY